MNKINLSLLIIILIVVFSGFFYQEALNNSKKNDLVSNVNAAVKLVETKGEASFPEFYTDKWFKGDEYIFIWQLNGIRVVYPPDPAGVNKNMTDLKDYTNKPIGKLFIETAQKGEGWVEYIWPKPGETTPSTKITFIKKAVYGNQTYLVGSGIYLD
ncbi:MAG: cache domain-containing protein [Methanobacteriaceae archaeon]|nr:cache domain-containing protein [Methanobacteriaceae archaeon]